MAGGTDTIHLPPLASVHPKRKGVSCIEQGLSDIYQGIRKGR